MSDSETAAPEAPVPAACASIKADLDKCQPDQRQLHVHAQSRTYTVKELYGGGHVEFRPS